MADLGDFYNAGAAMGGGRPTQAPQGTSAVGANLAVSGGLTASSIDLWGFLGLLALSYLLLHLE